MLLDRITKETTDHARFVYDFYAEGLLDPGETLTLSSAVIALGETGWSEAPFPAPGAPPPYDPTPLLFQTAVLDVTKTKLVTFVEYGTPGNVYTCVFLVTGTSGRQITCELAVQITGEPPEQPLPVPVDGGSKPALGLSIYGGTMLGPLYLYQNPLYPTEAATKYYVDHVAGATGGPFLSISGGTMEGPLVLAADPVNPMDAATRQYVDLVTGLIGGPYLPLTGGTLHGDLHFDNNASIYALYPGNDTSIFRVGADRQELDLYSTGGGGVWVFTTDTAVGGTPGVGIGSGNVTAGPGGSGTCWVYSGNSWTGTSGIVYVQSGNTDLDPATATLAGPTGDVVVGSGNAVNAKSGDLNLYTGNSDNPDHLTGRSSGVVDITTGIAGGTGNKSGDINIHPGAVIGGATQGRIVLSAPSIASPDGQDLNFAAPGGGSVWVYSDDTTGTTASGFAGVVSGYTASANSGPTMMGSGDSSAANSGPTTIYTGNGLATGTITLGTGNASAGNSGNVVLQTGTATGTRGDIILDTGAGPGSNQIWIDTPQISSHAYFWFQTVDGANSGGFGGMSGAGIGGTSGDSWFGTGDTDGAGSGMCGFGTGNVTGSGTSGHIDLVTGTSSAGVSGDIILHIGTAPTVGNIVLHNYKTADPHVAGAIWCDTTAGRVLKVSAG